MMNLEGFGRMQSWPKQGTTLAFVWRDWGKPRRISVIIASVLAQSKTKHLPNLSLEHYCYTNLPGDEMAIVKTFDLHSNLVSWIHLFFKKLYRNAFGLTAYPLTESDINERLIIINHQLYNWFKVGQVNPIFAYDISVLIPCNILMIIAQCQFSLFCHKKLVYL
jgi:hypothetical protein